MGPSSRTIEVDTEEKLVGRLRGGDTVALEALIDLYGPRVYRVVHRITGNEADTEEVVQDVFLTLFRKLDTFEGQAGLRSWLYKIATNAALNKRRGKRSEVEVSLEDYLPRFQADGRWEKQPGLLPEDWSQTPEEDLLSQETQVILNRAIDELPDHYRAVLVLRDVEGLSNEETAEALGESIASVKTRLHRARMALRERLSSHFRPSQSSREGAARC